MGCGVIGLGSGGNYGADQYGGKLELECVEMGTGHHMSGSIWSGALMKRY